MTVERAHLFVAWRGTSAIRVSITLDDRVIELELSDRAAAAWIEFLARALSVDRTAACDNSKETDEKATAIAP